MSKAIWKFSLGLAPGDHPVLLPEGARILSCGVQGDFHYVFFWAECDTSAQKTQRIIHVRMTGQDPPEHARFIGTCLFDNGAYVLHVYEPLPEWPKTFPWP